MSWIAGAGTEAVVAGIVGTGFAGSASAGTFGQQVRMCAHTAFSSLSIVANANGLRRFSSPRTAAPVAGVAQPALWPRRR